MPWRFVKQPNGMLAQFSTIVDDFIAWDMTEAEAYDAALEDMGRKDAKAKVERGLRDLDPITEKPGDGLSRFREAIETIRIVHGVKRADHRVLELGGKS